MTTILIVALCVLGWLVCGGGGIVVYRRLWKVPHHPMKPWNVDDTGIACLGCVVGGPFFLAMMLAFYRDAVSPPEAGEGIKMARYQKKPIIVDAVRVLNSGRTAGDPDGPLFSEQPIPLWLMEAIRAGIVVDCIRDARDYYTWDISTPEGVIEALPGDWIIRGINGEFDSCKPGIFEATYEPVPEECQKTGE